MHVIAYVIVVGWAIFWLSWFVASAGVKAGQTRTPWLVGVRVLIIVVVILVLRTGVLRGHSSTVDNPWLQAFGFVAFLMGLALAVWARVFLGRNWGAPMSQKFEPESVTSGPYRFIRHPIYSGIILALIGSTLAVSLYWAVVVVLLGAYFVYSAVVEERIMANLFPDSYPEYKRSTKMLIPFIF